MNMIWWIAIYFAFGLFWPVVAAISEWREGEDATIEWFVGGMLFSLMGPVGFILMGMEWVAESDMDFVLIKNKMRKQ